MVGRLGSNRFSVRLKPSSAHIWALEDGCLGYAELMTKIRLEESVLSDDALEGLAVHWAAEIIHTSGCKVVDMLGISDPRGTVIGESMLDSLYMYSSFTGAMLRGCSLGGLEEEFVLNEYVKGSTDAWSYDERTGELCIADLKYGHRIVEPCENWQLIIYAIGLILKYNLRPAKIRFTIVQPRANHHIGPIRYWDCKDITPYWDHLFNRIATIVKGGNELKSGSYCTTCPAALYCGSAQQSAYAALDFYAKPVPVDLEPHQLDYELAILERGEEAIKARRESIKAQVALHAERGFRFQYHDLEDSYTNLKWKDKDEAKANAETLGVNILKAEDLITPTQAKAKGMPYVLVMELAQRYFKGKILKRTKPNEGRRIFNV